MSAVPLSQKLIVLCLLDRCKHPLTAQQLDIYMVENHWSDYMLLQQLKCELQEAEFVTVSPSAPHFFMLAPRGRDALALFISRIPPYLRRQVEDFVSKNQDRMLRESTVFTQIRQQDDGAYLLQLRLFEGQHMAMELNLRIATRQEAEVMQERFCAQAQTLHQQILAFHPNDRKDRI